MSRVDEEATAFGDRRAPYLLGVEANWQDPGADDDNLAWTRRCIDALDIGGPHGHSRGMATTARHQGTCGRCQRPINIGDKIAKSDRVIGWLHEECAEMSDQAEEIPASDFADRYKTGPTDR